MRLLLVLSCVGWLTGCGVAPERVAGAEPVKPNVVLLFVDDWGWSDTGRRNPAFETPNIDQMAEDGLDFTQAYIACPTCSPSRATLLTGLHPARLRMVRHIPNDEAHGFDKFGRTDEPTNLWDKDPAQFPCPNWLALEYTTYAEAMKPLGYDQGFVGKWHLGHEPYHPVKQGFDSQFGTSNAGHPRSYYPPYFKHSEVLAQETDAYLTDRLTDGAVDYIAQHDGERPFMLSLWYYAVHGPQVGRRDLLAKYEARGLTGKRAHYAAMVEAVDESVGRVRRALAGKGIEDNTVVILMSDQGSMFDNSPFRGGKREDTLYEGGARVPLTVVWPGVTTPGTTNDSVVQSTDLFPTLVEIAGGDPADFKDLDGVSLLSVIRGGGELDRGAPVFGYRAYEDLYASVRSGDWKLLAFRSGEMRLYNLAADLGEVDDVAGRHPERVAELRGALSAWEKKMGVEAYSGVQ